MSSLPTLVARLNLPYLFRDEELSYTIMSSRNFVNTHVGADQFTTAQMGN